MMAHDALMQLSYDKWLRLVSAEILQRAQQNLGRYFPDLEGRHSLQVVLTRPPRRKRYTVIFDLAVQEGEGVPLKSMIAKAYRLPAKPGVENQYQSYIDKSRYEFDVHQKIAGYFEQQAQQTHTVVKLYDYLPEVICLIIERAAGQDLGSIIQQIRYSPLRYRQGFAQLGAHFQRTGAWLALFHSGFENGKPLPFAGDRMTAHFQRMFEKFAAGGLPALQLRSLQKRVEAIIPAFNGVAQPQALLHGGFKPCHVFVTDAQVITIDFGNAFTGTILDEVAHMLAETQLVHFGLALPAHVNLVSHLQQRFVEGYFGEKEWQPLLRFHFISWLCAKWERRLRKHKWMTHPVAKQTNRLVPNRALRNIINRRYVTPWFHGLVLGQLDKLERQLH